jgi:cytochrome c biogenesis protein CcdA
LTRVGILGAPRPYPERQRWLGPGRGALVIALALPLFLDRRLASRRLGRRGAALGRRPGARPAARAREAFPDNVAASGALAFGMMCAAAGVLAVLLALVASDKDAGLAAALLYGAAYTAELGFSLLGYYGQEPRA